MKENETKVWRINIKIGTKKVEDMEAIQRQCLPSEYEKEGIGYIAIGWPVNTNELNSKKEYQKELKSNNISSNLAEKMKEEYQKLALKKYINKDKQTNTNKKPDGRIGVVNASNNIFKMSKKGIYALQELKKIYII